MATDTDPSLAQPHSCNVDPASGDLDTVTDDLEPPAGDLDTAKFEGNDDDTMDMLSANLPENMFRTPDPRLQVDVGPPLSHYSTREHTWCFL